MTELADIIDLSGEIVFIWNDKEKDLWLVFEDFQDASEHADAHGGEIFEMDWIPGNFRVNG